MRAPPVAQVGPDGLAVRCVGGRAGGLAAVDLRIRHDAPQEGIAWQAAGMATRGAGGMGRVAFARSLDALGASLSVTAGHHRTSLRLLVPSSRLAAAASIAAEGLAPDFIEADFDAQKGRVVGWWAARAAEPRSHPGHYLDLLTYAGTPRALPAVGRPPAVALLEVSDLRGFSTSSWRRGDAHLGIASSLPEAEAIEAVSPLLALPRGGTRSGHGEPTGWGRRGFLAGTSPGAVVLARWPLPARVDPSWGDLATGVEVVGGGMSGLLFGEVRRRRGLAYSVGLAARAGRMAGRAEMRMEVDPARLPEAIAAARRTLEGAGRSLAKGRVAAAVRTARRGRWLEVEGTADLAGRLAAESDLGLGPLATLAEPDALSTDPDLVSGLCRRWLDPEAATWVVGADPDLVPWEGMAAEGFERESLAWAEGLEGALGLA